MKSNEEKKKKKIYNAIILEEKTVDQVFQLIISTEMARLVGLFSHLSYWLIFGTVNPVLIEKSVLKQMLVNIGETFNQLCSLSR